MSWQGKCDQEYTRMSEGNVVQAIYYLFHGGT